MNQGVQHRIHASEPLASMPSLAGVCKIMKENTGDTAHD
jgi:hypothetical protein